MHTKLYAAIHIIYSIIYSSNNHFLLITSRVQVKQIKSKKIFRIIL